jgi:ketosteroid isomerase-like protein
MTREYVAAVQNEIREVLDSVALAFREGRSQEQILALMYTDDVVVVRQGEAAPVRGMAELMRAAASMLAELGPHPDFSFRFGAPVLAGGDVAVCMLDVAIRPDIDAAEPMHHRIMTGWKKNPDGWRVSLEMVGEGSL